VKQLSTSQLKLFSSLKQKKYRDKEGLFLIEGWHLFEECLKSDYIPEVFIISENLRSKYEEKISEFKRIKKFEIYYLKLQLFNKLSETRNSQGIVCVVRTKGSDSYDSVKYASPVLALDEINDPGNLGTILRTAYWFNSGAVILGKNTVDVYNDKVLRASQGALFHLNFKTNADLNNDLFMLKQKGYEIFLLSPQSDVTLEKTDFKDNVCFVFGNEARGINEAIKTTGYKEISIKGFSDCESLNVAISIGIVLHYYRLKISGFELPNYGFS
jgi:TrmH family RNA methyltransferase